MANRAKGWNLKNHYMQIMENKQKKRETKERIRACEEAKKAAKAEEV